MPISGHVEQPSPGRSKDPSQVSLINLSGGWPNRGLPALGAFSSLRGRQDQGILSGALITMPELANSASLTCVPRDALWRLPYLGRTPSVSGEHGCLASPNDMPMLKSHRLMSLAFLIWGNE